MRIANSVYAAALAATVAAVPALADTAADAAGEVRALLTHSPALQADGLQVEIEGNLIYIRGVVDTQLEYNQIEALAGRLPGARIVNSTAVAGSGS